MGRIVNSSLLGAIAAAVQAPPIDALERVVYDSAPVNKEQNVRACREGYDTMHGLLDVVGSAA